MLSVGARHGQIAGVVLLRGLRTGLAPHLFPSPHHLPCVLSPPPTLVTFSFPHDALVQSSHLLDPRLRTGYASATSLATFIRRSLADILSFNKVASSSAVPDDRMVRVRRATL